MVWQHGVIMLYSFYAHRSMLKTVAVPRLYRRHFPLTYLFHGFKNPRLFALRASRLYRRFYNDERITMNENRLKDVNTNSRGLLSPRLYDGIHI